MKRPRYEDENYVSSVLPSKGRPRINREANNSAPQQLQQLQQQSPQQLQQSAKKEKSKLKAPSNWAKLIGTMGSLKEDLSSDETVGRRRRAYTDMDDLLNNDIM